MCTRHCRQHDNDKCKMLVRHQRYKQHLITRLTGELRGVFCQFVGDKISALGKGYESNRPVSKHNTNRHILPYICSVVLIYIYTIYRYLWTYYYQRAYWLTTKVMYRYHTATYQLIGVVCTIWFHISTCPHLSLWPRQTKTIFCRHLPMHFLNAIFWISIAISLKYISVSVI